MSNSIFQVDNGYTEKILIPDGKDFKITESYQHYCFEDLIGYNSEYFCFTF